MPFTSDNSKVNHYPGTSKGATEQGYEREEMPRDDGSSNMGRLHGRRFPAIPESPAQDTD